jgi:protein involved in temperature-dependent protein secretion
VSTGVAAAAARTHYIATLGHHVDFQRAAQQLGETVDELKPQQRCGAMVFKMLFEAVSQVGDVLQKGSLRVPTGQADSRQQL